MSDIHCGPRFERDILLQAIHEINDLGPNAIVVTGDLTENGLFDEFQEAKRYIQLLKCKHLLTGSGNHDSRTTGYRLFPSFFGNLRHVVPEQIRQQHHLLGQNPQFHLRRRAAEHLREALHRLFVQPLAVVGPVKGVGQEGIPVSGEGFQCRLELVGGAHSLRTVPDFSKHGGRGEASRLSTALIAALLAPASPWIER